MSKQTKAAVLLTEEEYNELIKDRNDFGFDSIYFRYAMAIDEIVRLRKIVERPDSEKLKHYADTQKEHFYHTLEQWTQTHKEND
jgi:hypothetical protein